MIFLLRTFFCCFFGFILLAENSDLKVENESQKAADTVSTQFSGFKNSGVSIGDKYGNAKLARLENQTSFPLKIKMKTLASGQGSDESFFLKNNDLVRFKVLSDQFVKKPFVRYCEEILSETKSISRSVLRSDGFFSQAEDVLFLVNIFFENGQKYIEISPKKNLAQKIGVGSDQNPFFVASLDNSFFQANILAKRWEVFGDNNKCYLKNAKSGGFLGPSESKALTESFGSESGDLSFGNVLVFSPKNNNLNLTLSPVGQINLSTENGLSWCIKGEHSAVDRLNCCLGQKIENGAIVRLENIDTSKNLTVLMTENISFDNDDFEKKKIGEAGLNGIGSEQDNWMLVFQENKKSLQAKDIFFLKHLVSGAFLCVDEEKNLFGLLKKEESSKNDVAKAVENVQQMNLSKTEKQDSSPSSEKKKKTVATAKDMFLEQKKFQLISFVKNKINKNNLLQTGFENGAAYEKTGTIVANNQELAVEVVEAGDKDFLPPKSDRWFSDFLLKNNVVNLDGMTKANIPDLLPGMSLLISPLYEKGIVWLAKSLDKSNETAFTFLVKKEENSKFAIVLGNSISDQYVYKFVFDDDYNSLKKMQIIKENIEEEEIIAISNRENPCGKILPGQVTSLWVLFQDGKLFLGKTSVVGAEMFFAFEDHLFQSVIDRIGFSCGTKGVFISSLEFQAMKEIKKPSRVYKKTIELQKTKPKAALEFKGFRQPDQALFLLKGKQLGNEKFYFFNENAVQQYALNLNFQTGEIIIQKTFNNDEKTIFHTKNNLMLDFKNKDEDLWLHYSQGFFWVGLSDFGKNSLFCFKDEEPINGIKKFSLQEGNKTFLTVDSYSEISFSDKDSDVDQGQTDEAVLIGNKIVAVSPFSFELKQENEQVILKDSYSKKSYLVAQAQKKDMDYSFLLKIDDSGIPSMRLAWQPESESLLALKWQAKALATTSEALNLASSHIEGSGSIGQQIGSVASVTTASLSIPIAFAMANIKGALKVAEREQSSQKKNITQRYDVENKLNSDIPSIAIANRYQLESMLDDLEKFSPSTKNVYLDLLNRYKKILSLIINPYVVETEQIRSTIKQGLKALYDYQKKAETFLSDSTVKEEADTEDFVLMIRETLLEVLVNAINNPYLFSNDNKGFSEKKTWFAWANILAQNVIENREDKHLELPKMFGECFWMKDKLKKTGKGKVYFKAKGVSDIWIFFAKTPRVFDEQKEFYTVVIRNDDKNTGIIKLKSFGSIACSIDSEDLKLSELENKEYFVQINDGRINVGLVDRNADLVEETVVFSFLDEYPEKNELFVGFGSWLSSCSISEIKVF